MAVQVVQAVQAVHLESDAFLVCVNHALSTEKEEAVGLCTEELNDDTRSDSKLACTGNEMCTVGEKVDTVRIVYIHSVIILRCSDKRKDQVEISPEQLSAASTETESCPMRAAGWYHSYLYITVWPSHVDVHTQAMYQMMDQGFVGLIFSSFIEDKNTKTGQVLYTCFQSKQAQKKKKKETPIHVVPHVTIGKVCLESVGASQDPVQMSAVSGPLLQWLEDRLEQNQQHLQELQQEKKELLQELSSLDESS
uniref:MPN domain-containing protein n=1 Tax=Cavia porcellus TaxID=10141 RepID=A0A286Y5K5_CAVPO